MSDNIQVSKPTMPMQNRGGYFYPLTSGDQVIINDNQKLGNLFDLIYPIGSIYMSINDTDPSILFGGTWKQIQDRFLLSAGNTYTAGSTGGKAEHKHGLNDNAAALIGNHGDTTAFSPNYNFYLGTNYNINNGAYCWAHTHDNPFNSDNSKFSLLAAVGLVGNTVSASNIPPYYAVYMWQRIG